MRFIKANSLKLCIDVVGTGMPLLFIGGTGWDLRRDTSPLESCLSENYTVALYDQRGMGRSDKPAAPYTMRDYADDANGALDALNWKKAHVVGYSFGGMVAQEMAINYPERVHSLVLAASSPGGAGGSSYPVHELLSHAPFERARLGLQVADHRFNETFQREQPGEARAMIEKRMRTQQQFIQEPGALAGQLAQLNARAQHDCYSRLGEIQAPTLVLAGEHDGQAPSDYQKNMTAQIPNAVFRQMSGGHNFIFENDYFFRAVSEFLQCPEP